MHVLRIATAVVGVVLFAAGIVGELVAYCGGATAGMRGVSLWVSACGTQVLGCIAFVGSLALAEAAKARAATAGTRSEDEDAPGPG